MVRVPMILKYASGSNIRIAIIEIMGFNAYFSSYGIFADSPLRNNIWYNTRGSGAGSNRGIFIKYHMNRPLETQIDLRALPEPQPKDHARY
jgi:hypothetical protein